MILKESLGCWISFWSNSFEKRDEEGEEVDNKFLLIECLLINMKVENQVD